MTTEPLLKRARSRRSVEMMRCTASSPTIRWLQQAWIRSSRDAVSPSAAASAMRTRMASGWIVAAASPGARKLRIAGTASTGPSQKGLQCARSTAFASVAAGAAAREVSRFTAARFPNLAAAFSRGNPQ